jgi:hypothetical protein
LIGEYAIGRDGWLMPLAIVSLSASSIASHCALAPGVALSVFGSARSSPIPRQKSLPARISLIVWQGSFYSSDRSSFAARRFGSRVRNGWQNRLMIVVRVPHDRDLEG